MDKKKYSDLNYQPDENFSGTDSIKYTVYNPNNDNGNENASGDIYYHTNDDRVVVWFDDVVRWEGTAGSGTYNFQIVLYSDGTFRCNYDQMTGTTDQSTIGWQDQNGQQGTQVSTVGEGFVSNNFSNNCISV